MCSGALARRERVRAQGIRGIFRWALCDGDGIRSSRRPPSRRAPDDDRPLIRLDAAQRDTDHPVLRRIRQPGVGAACDPMFAVAGVRAPAVRGRLRGHLVDDRLRPAVACARSDGRSLRKDRGRADRQPRGGRRLARLRVRLGLGQLVAPRLQRARPAPRDPALAAWIGDSVPYVARQRVLARFMTGSTMGPSSDKSPAASWPTRSAGG